MSKKLASPPRNGNARQEPESRLSNLDAERSILGATLLDNFAYTEAKAAGIAPDYFFHDSHRRIWRAIDELATAAIPVDIITLAQELAKREEVEKIGGVAYLSSLTDGLPYKTAVGQYVEIVRDCYRRRELAYKCDLAVQQMADWSEDFSDCASRLVEEVQSLRADTITHPARHIAEIAADAVNEISQQMYAAREVIGLPFGINELDLETTGIRDGEYIVVGGFPGAGKTSFATGVALNVARQDVPVQMFSIEMTQAAVAKRILSQYTEVSAKMIRNPRHLHTSDLRTLQDAVEMLKKIPFWVDDRCGQDVYEIVARAHLAVARRKVKLIIVDFLQLLTAQGEKRSEQVGRASKALCEFAKQTGVPVIVLSQLSRPDNKDPNTRPNIFMLRESGEIEQHAHLALFTYRPVDEKGEPTGADELIIGKQREGIVGRVPAYYDKRALMWKERPLEKEIDTAQSALKFDGKEKSSKKAKGAKDGDGAKQGTVTKNQGASEGPGRPGPEDDF